MEIVLFLQGREANLLSRVLDEVKTTIFEKSETSLSDKEACQISVNPLSKRLFLGHIIGREGSTDTASASRQG